MIEDHHKEISALPPIGSGFYRNFSQDLKAAIPEAEGFSRQNLQYMKKMYLLYSQASENCPQLVGNFESEICPQTVGDFIFSVPWGIIELSLINISVVLKTEQDNPTIGLLICKDKDNVLAF